MKKLIVAVIMTFALLGATSQPSQAFFGGGYYFKKHYFHKWHFKKPPKVVKTPQSGRLGNSQSSWVPKYVFAATTCSALMLWVQALHTGHTQKRELTQKEAWTTVGNCFLPIIGGHIMGSLAQQP